MKILVAPNSYKECADSFEISKIICESLSEINSLKVISRPLSDGGDGFLSVIKNIYDVNETKIVVSDEFNQKKIYKILIDNKTDTAYLESAAVIGLKCIEEKNRKPLLLNSALIGKIIKKLTMEVNNSKIKIKNLIIGIGGTATIDFGIGACTQLGLSLMDSMQNQITPFPKYFNLVSSIQFVKPDFPFNLKCIVDVNTELIGEPGAIEIYGKQKGAAEIDLKIIKGGIKNILDIVTANKNFTIPQKLNGAGGGLASGLNIFLNAEIIYAEDFITKDLLYDLIINEIDAVITGEGNFDYQSFEGKGAGIILKMFDEKNIPIFLINGSTNLTEGIHLPKNVSLINLIDFFDSKEESIKKYKAGIAKAVQIVLNHLNK